MGGSVLGVAFDGGTVGLRRRSDARRRDRRGAQKLVVPRRLGTPTTRSPSSATAPVRVACCSCATIPDVARCCSSGWVPAVRPRGAGGGAPRDPLVRWRARSASRRRPRAADGPERACGLAAWIQRAWESIGRPCSVGLRVRVDMRRSTGRAYDPERAVLVHGDDHQLERAAFRSRLQAGRPRRPDGRAGIRPGHHHAGGPDGADGGDPGPSAAPSSPRSTAPTPRRSGTLGVGTGSRPGSSGVQIRMQPYAARRSCVLSG